MIDQFHIADCASMPRLHALPITAATRVNGSRTASANNTSTLAIPAPDQQPDRRTHPGAMTSRRSPRPFRASPRQDGPRLSVQVNMGGCTTRSIMSRTRTDRYHHHQTSRWSILSRTSCCRFPMTRGARKRVSDARFWATVQQFANLRLLYLHVGPSGQEALVHGCEVCTGG